MYFWYSHGMALSWKGVPRLRRYQSATMSRPSGLMVGSRTRITLSLIARISALSSVATRHASSIDCWAEATSLACRPLSIHTTALPSAASARASASLKPRTSARRFEMSLKCASCCRLSGDEMTATSISRPSVEVPADDTSTRSEAAARRWK